MVRKNVHSLGIECPGWKMEPRDSRHAAGVSEVLRVRGRGRQRLWNQMSCEKPWTEQVGEGWLSKGSLRRGRLRRRRKPRTVRIPVKMEVNVSGAAEAPLG